MAKRRTIVTPGAVSDFSNAGGKAYWKQIIPMKQIEYTTRSGKRATIDFSASYIDKLIKDFNAKSDVTPFLLADKDNAHTMDPERFRGAIDALRLAEADEQPGLYGKVLFPTKKMARAVEMSEGSLPVSARIREDENGPTLVHVLGTLDPQVNGMEKWQPADLSRYDDGNVLDLSNSDYVEGNTVAKKANKVPDISTFTEEDIDAMSAKEVDAFLATYAPESSTVVEDDDDEDDDDLEDDDDDDLEDEGAGNRKLVGAGAELSKRAKRDIELANSQAAVANARSNEAMRRMAAAEFREYRSAAITAGVPPHLLDLAEPILNRADDMVIDLSNSGEEDVNVAVIVRQFIDAAKGTIDTDIELGHQGNFQNGDGTDPDAELLKQWETQF